MITLGVDLAAEPRGTALATIAWSSRGARVLDVVVGADDAAVLDAIRRADRAGLDVPLGWPDSFVDFVVAHRDGHTPVPRDLTGLALRRTLSRRATDVHVSSVTRVVPMSVSADRIASVSMRAAGLLAVLAEEGDPVDRTGAGRVMEVYPAASLRHWGLPSGGYKGKDRVGALTALVQLLADGLPDLDWGPWRVLCRTSDHAFDAVVCSLVARAAHLGCTLDPPAELHAQAGREGWIRLPTCGLSDLIPQRRRGASG